MALAPIDFSTFVVSLGRSTEVQLSGEDGPPDVELARQNVEILQVLQEKTKGNLNDEEAKLLEVVLYHARMAVVGATKS